LELDDPQNHIEAEQFFVGTVGTTITNAENTRVTIAAIETVTVPAGTFTNCIKFHKTDLGSGAPNPTMTNGLLRSGRGQMDGLRRGCAECDSGGLSAYITFVILKWKLSLFVCQWFWEREVSHSRECLTSREAV